MSDQYKWQLKGRAEGAERRAQGRGRRAEDVVSESSDFGLPTSHLTKT
jgi:hypothetical protein